MFSTLVSDDGPDVMPARVQPDDIKTYYEAFRRLVDLCGKYEHDKKLLHNASDGVLKAQVVMCDYYGPTNPGDKLASTVTALKSLRKVALTTLDYWSRRVGFLKMSTPEDVERYHLNVRADTVILLDYLQYADFRKRLRYRIDKYAGKGELKSAAELVGEVLASYKKRPSKSS